MHQMTYRPDIDGLRAVAIILVVLFHAFPDLMPGGFIGVDIFFVISGYLISGVILSRLAAGTYSFADFYRRRILRIFPALVIVLGLCLVAGCLLFTPNVFQSLGKHVLGGAAFISNILLYNETGYFDAAAHAKPLLNLWSLGIEEQFYLIFPLFMWIFWRYAIGRRQPNTLSLSLSLSKASSLRPARLHLPAVLCGQHLPVRATSLR